MLQFEPALVFISLVLLDTVYAVLNFFTLFSGHSKMS